MKIAIIIPTYQRSDGKTPYFLTKALESIKNQNNNNYKVFLIGDKYEDNKEFESIAKIIDEDKIFYENLPIALERDKYLNVNNEALWCCGGVNAINYAIDVALSEGYEFMAHLDHDDIWFENHLEEINNVIEERKDATFIYTQSRFINDQILPNFESNGDVIIHPPVQSNTVHSSICANFKILKSRYRDVFASEGSTYPADADLWNRISKELNEDNNLNSYLIKKITCSHETEKE